MGTVLSVQKSLDIIDAVAATGSEGVGTRELARQLGINPTSVHNIAATLVQRGYLRQDEVSRRYRLGLHLLTLAGGEDFSHMLVELSRPVLEKLADEVHESVMLAGLVNGRIMKLDAVVCNQPLRVDEPDDIASYAHCMACGKMLLSAMTDNELKRFLTTRPLEKYTAGTIISKAKLAGELDNIRKAGQAEVVDELCDGISAIAVGIEGPRGGVVASLGVSVPSVRFKLLWRNQTLKKLKAAAKEISQLCKTS